MLLPVQILYDSLLRLLELVLFGDQVPTDQVLIEVLVDLLLRLQRVQLHVALVNLLLKFQIRLEVLYRNFSLTSVLIAERNVLLFGLRGLHLRGSLEKVTLQFL